MGVCASLSNPSSVSLHPRVIPRRRAIMRAHETGPSTAYYVVFAVLVALLSRHLLIVDAFTLAPYVFVVMTEGYPETFGERTRTQIDTMTSCCLVCVAHVHKKKKKKKKKKKVLSLIPLL